MTKEEHWAGVADAAMRRKLQNRLNKRASRQRKIQSAKAQTEIRPITFAEAYERLGQKVLFKPLSDPDSTAHNAALSQGQQASTHMCTTLTSALVERTIDFGRYFATTYRTCITSSPDFRTYVTRTSLYPLSVDHAVLTLMHFNLIRALTHNIEMLGVEPDQMMDDDWWRIGPRPINILLGHQNEKGNGEIMHAPMLESNVPSNMASHLLKFYSLPSETSVPDSGEEVGFTELSQYSMSSQSLEDTATEAAEPPAEGILSPATSLYFRQGSLNYATFTPFIPTWT
ncbi:hypothetical protein BP5796_01327 [Coleophoma crateriformis]|uniref:BZIP domain-containing protein n=1 Tax=Coleophoma crateriformis TaxID=565419 RepID=A0A3D8T039_9HELO|nr:hypothetical protein BP5796_01327 [Coleophoma crateriformis]